MNKQDSQTLLKPDILILREKDLTEMEYEILAKEIIPLCNQYEIECILHNYINIARKLNDRKIHLPFSIFESNWNLLSNYQVIGVSCHSVEDALFAEQNGATYITAGHIFATDCKKNKAPRGIEFLKQVCDAVNIPVYAIGGINNQNMTIIQSSGADGACLMSQYMKED